MSTNKSILRAHLYALIVVALLLLAAAPASAQHEGHDMSNMPGVNKPKPKRKPKTRAKPAAAKRRAPAQAVPKQAETDGGNESEDSVPVPASTEPAPAPEPAASPEPEQAPAGVHRHTDAPAEAGATPAAPPAHEKMDAKMPAPEASPDGPQPAAAPHKHDMGDMDMSAPAGGAQPSHEMAMEMFGMVLGSNGRITSRTGSGTMWQPASTPMPMLHWMKGDWMVMMHADVKLGVNSQGGPRGVTKFESQNWLMAMASRRVGRGTLDLRSMFSLEPLTLSGPGSPQLFQTGESYNGRPIRDAQHPHDLFMTLSASYSVPIGERGSWFAYFGLPGEPALGPVAFMHRASAAENPAAPLAHHLQDSTHISYGVFTTGFTYRWFKVEGSVFNGREPDEDRYDIEFNPWNSRSFRVQFAPNRNWAAQVSYGFLKNPEALEPGDVRRTTASLSYNKQLKRGNWATTFIWGRNREGHHDEPSTLNGYTLESTLQFLDRNYLYTRLELVDKSGLLDDEDRELLGIEDHHPIFRIGAYTFGAARDIWGTEKFTVALGGDVTFYSKPPILDAVYGNNPTSYRFFLRFRLGRMSTNPGGTASTHATHGTAASGSQP
ncbi:MAG TPA: hypothetical protein VD861_00760 [Pyrinomonadaceae bacterium]|nr:hypothetical protein [Pyrinomonadaceae bacterium]